MDIFGAAANRITRAEAAVVDFVTTHRVQFLHGKGIMCAARNRNPVSVFVACVIGSGVSFNGHLDAV